MKYAVGWIDSYNTWNWRDKNIDEELDIDKDGVGSISGVKNIKKCFPVDEIDVGNDGWADCSHSVEFEADNIEDAKKRVREILEENGRNIDVFSISVNGETILTEEDFFNHCS